MSERSGRAGAREEGRGAEVLARRLSRRFGPHRALAEVDLHIARGESFGLLGANGAGKTTFIRLVTGYLAPSSGRIEVDGFCPVRRPREVHARVGFVPETSRLYPELRVSGFLRFVGAARGLAGAALTRAVERTLGSFQLEEVAGRLVGNLSKGFQQRVSLAQGYLHDPALLIVDEPTSGLDPLQRQEVRQVLTAAAGERTLLICTHDLAEARELTRRVAVLDRGHCVAVGPTEEVLGRDDPLELFRGRPDLAEAGR